MSEWARDNPERMEEIARLPLNEQNAAMRDAVGYDPDRVRDEQAEALRAAHTRRRRNVMGQTTWVITNLEEMYGVTLTVGSTDEVLLKQIEQAAALHGIELERVP